MNRQIRRYFHNEKITVSVHIHKKTIPENFTNYIFSLKFMKSFYSLLIICYLIIRVSIIVNTLGITVSQPLVIILTCFSCKNNEYSQYLSELGKFSYNRRIMFMS